MRWTLTALGFAVMTAYWPGISGATTTPRWTVIAIAVPLLLFCGDRIKVTAAHALGLLFVAWCTLSLTWSASPLDGIDALWQLLLLAGMFALGSDVADFRPVIVGAASGIGISSAVMVAQWLGWIDLPSYHLPGGMFYNANYAAEAAALVAVACAAHRMWWGASMAAPSLILAGSRGALLAVFAAAAAWLWGRSRWAAIGLLAIMIGASALLASPAGQQSIERRLAIWSDTARDLSIAGHGIGSFRTAFPAHAVKTDLTHERPARAHNEPLDVAFETGLIGLALALTFCATLVGPLNPERLVLIALAVECCFAFPLHMPATAFLGMLVAGHAAGRRRCLRSAIVGGRDRLRAWLDTRSRRRILNRRA